ncbi:MAG TPA: hypothetical protein VGJ60_06970 [Chloroflexota bacterium]|jgi:hypothetical protein
MTGKHFAALLEIAECAEQLVDAWQREDSDWHTAAGWLTEAVDEYRNIRSNHSNVLEFPGAAEAL